MSEADLPKPGEIDLETGAVGLEEPPAVVVDEPAKTEEPAAVVDGADEVADPADKPKVNGVMAEMIEHRTVRKQLEKQLTQLQPVLSRLTPEMQEAIAEGRVAVKPRATSTDQRNDQLEATAKRLRLVKADGTPDTEAAGLVDSYVREVAQAAVAPYQQMTLADKAQQNITTAVEYAKANGYDVDTIKETLENALRAPNGAAMLANPDVAKELWFSAVGRAEAMGKGRKVVPAAGVTDPAKKTPAAVVTESTGRRGAAGIALSPALAKVYKDHGVDPTKSFSATKPNLDFSQGIELE